MHKTKPKWLAISGVPLIGDGTISYDALKHKSKKAITDDLSKRKEDSPNIAVVRSDTYFESGDITGEVKISAPDMKMFIRLGVAGSHRTSVGLQVNQKTYALAIINDSTMDEIDSSGLGSTPPLNEWFSFRIHVKGSKLEFFINNVCVIQGKVNILRAQIEILLHGPETIQLRNISIESMRPEVFVVMQFTEEFSMLFKEVISPVCSEYGYEVIRGDNIYTNGLIIEDISRSIRDSSLIIADITPNNANVYYEVGYAHGIDKPTILLSDRNREKLPFDISGFRLLFYDNTIGGKSAVEAALRRHLDAIRGI